MVKQVVAPALLTVVLGLLALFSVWAQQPWLVPSLGSAVFGQTLSPDHASGRAWNTAIGQASGLVCGFVAVYAAAAASVPTFMDHHPLVYARVLGVVIAALLTALAQVLLKATNPAGGATALIVALGAETPDAAGFGRIALGIVLVTVLGEAARHLVLRISSPERDRTHAR